MVQSENGNIKASEDPYSSEKSIDLSFHGKALVCVTQILRWMQPPLSVFAYFPAVTSAAWKA